MPALILYAIGVVFGDIGTSPLYTLKAVFSGGSLPVNEANILGILSIVFWSLIIVVSVKYLLFVMRADNHGEGGVIALTAIALRPFRKEHTKYLSIMSLGILGAGLFYGDSVITPAISVLSAIEGLKVAAPGLSHLVLPLTVAVLTLLFLFQVKGAGSIGQWFGPIMTLWFLTIALLGIFSIVANPYVLHALSPYHAAKLLIANKFTGFIALGGTFLALTGAEALYADMGHFGLRPIRLSWFWFVFPALVLNYFGQGALLLENSEAISQPFYLLAPNELVYPLILLATAATVIASQAVILGAFSMTQSAIRLGYLPVLDVRFTSEQKGQIYIPTINWLLFVSVISIVLTFKTSDNLAAAYGLAVTGTMVITTLLAFGVLVRLWKIRWWAMAPLFTLFLLIDLFFLGANSIKIVEGGWLPLFIAMITFTLMTTWRKGARLLRLRAKELAVPVEKLKDIVAKASARVPGMAIYMTHNASAVPSALVSTLIHNHVLHERLALLQVDIEDKPYVPAIERIELDHVASGLYIVRIHYGFKDEIDIPRALRLCEELKFHMEETTFYIGHETMICGDAIKMAKWRKRLFIGMFHYSSNFIDFCKIPANRIIEMGKGVEL